MAWGAVGLLGNQGSTGTSTTATLTTTIPAAVNNVVVLTAAIASQTTVNNTTSSAIRSVSDSANNDWVEARTFQATNGTRGVICSVWYSRLDNALSSLGTITININGASTHKAMGAFAYSVGPGVSVRAYDSTYISASTAQSPLSLDIAFPTQTEMLRFRGIGTETTLTTALTTSAGWTNIGTTRASALAPMSYRGEYLISSATTAASNPTLTSTSVDASVYVVFEETGLMGDGTF